MHIDTLAGKHREIKQTVQDFLLIFHRSFNLFLVKRILKFES